MKLHLFGYVIQITRQSTANEKKCSTAQDMLSEGKKAMEAKAPAEVSRLRRDINDYGDVIGEPWGWLTRETPPNVGKVNIGWLLTDEEEEAFRKGSSVLPTILPKLIKALKEEREAQGCEQKTVGMAQKVQGCHEVPKEEPHV